MNISYNWLKSYVPELPPAEELYSVFTYHLCEVEGQETLPDGDVVFDINILPNRAHDLLSHQGVARELASLLSLEFKDSTPMYKVPEAQPTKLAIDIQTENCRRYMGRVVRNITVGPSPEWIVNHLKAIGQRSINNIVDATNLVMFDCGQPMHAFDLAKISSPESPKIIIRQADDGTEFKTLSTEQDGVRKEPIVELTEKNMIIADEKEPIALAGVKGGLDSGVSEGTTDIVIEVANFDPASVRKTARKFNLLSDSSKRFENDLSPELCDFAMREITGLLIEMCPEAICEEIVDVYPKKQEPKEISFNIDRISKMLGLDLNVKEVSDILNRYHFDFTEKEGQFIFVRPALRLDLEGVHDMAEEIGRVIGYDRVTPKIPKIDFQPRVHEVSYKIMAVRKKLLSEGYSEIITYSFGDNGQIKVLKSAENKKGLRANIADGLKEAYEKNRRNTPVLELDEVKLFEIGTVFLKKEGESNEEIHVATANKKGTQEMTLNEYCAAHNITVGASYAEVLDIPAVSNKSFEPWSVYPFISRDIAVWTNGGADKEVLFDILKSAELLSKEPRLVDTFEKEGRTSYAYRLVFQSKERTLEDAEVNAIMDRLNGAIQAKGWEIR